MPPREAGPDRRPPRHDAPHDDRPYWHRSGWRLLAESPVDTKSSAVRLDVKDGQSYSKLVVVVTGGTLHMVQTSLTLVGGPKTSPNIDKVFVDGDHYEIDLGNNARPIENFYFRYKSGETAATGNPHVQLFGLESGRRGFIPNWPIRNNPVGFGFMAPVSRPAPSPIGSAIAPLSVSPTSVPAPARGTTPYSRPAPAPSPVAQVHTGAWNSRGWKMLAKGTVDPKSSAVRLDVPASAGRIDRLMIVSRGGQFRMTGTKITFTSGHDLSPNIEHVFKSGERYEYALRDNRPLGSFYFRFTDVSNGPSEVELWGVDSSTLTPAQPAWTPAGWTLLGAKDVTGRRDRDTVHVSNATGNFSALTLSVEGGEIELFNMNITFTDGQTFAPNLRELFRGEQRTRAIDLPGGARTIRKIDFHYGKLTRGGRAKVSVWGKPANTPPQQSGPTWDQRGWTLLGNRAVTGFRKVDTIPVRAKGTYFTSLTLAVDHGDVEIFDIVVHFADGLAFRPNIRQYFRGGERSKTLDLPREARLVTKVTFRYGNLPRGQRATVQLWGKAGTAPVDSWEASGWIELGDKLVNRRGNDRIRVGRNKGGFSKLVLVADGSDLDVTSLVVKFGRGRPVTIPVTHAFRDGSTSREIDLPGNSIAIQWIELRYSTLPTTSTSRVKVYAK